MKNRQRRWGRRRGVWERRDDVADFSLPPRIIGFTLVLSVWGALYLWLA